MTRDEFLDKQYHLSVQAGMNQRYHQKYATFWWRWDTIVRGSTAAAAVLGALISLASYMNQHSAGLSFWSASVSIVTAIIAVILNVVPIGSWEQSHRDLLRQWTDLREDIELLLYDCAGDPGAQILCDLKKLEAKMHRICGQEPAPDDTLLKTCYDAEERSRHCKVAA
jgi:hypothetical protein